MISHETPPRLKMMLIIVCRVNKCVNLGFGPCRLEKLGALKRPDLSVTKHGDGRN